MNAIPADAPKEQIRRLSIVHAARHAEKIDLFVSFLDQSALTVSKKAFFLRKVHGGVVAPDSDINALVARAKALGVVAMMAIVEGLPDNKTRELADACAGAGLTVRIVAPDEVQKRSVAIDIMVDLMLLPGED